MGQSILFNEHSAEVLHLLDQFVYFRERQNTFERHRRADFPSASVLANILNVAFWASLAEEEGRGLRFTLAYAQPDKCPGAFHFQLPKLLTANTVRKLAPAVAPPRNVMCVNGEERAKLWGFSFEATPFKSFHVDVRKPGKLRLRCGDLIFGTVTPESETVLLAGNRLIDMITAFGIEFQTTQELVERDKRTSAIFRIFTEMPSIGTGGILLVVPNASALVGAVSTPIKYSKRASCDFGPGLDGIGRPRRSVISSSDGERTALLSNYVEQWQQDDLSAAEIVKIVARLTAVDGATVIDFSLNVLGFGAKITSSSDQDFEILEITVGAKNKGKKIRLTNYGGMRHQSAARFAYKCRTSVALVCSQDGAMTIFLWSKHDQCTVALVVTSLV